MVALSCVAVVNNAFFAWTPAMLQRLHHWEVQNAGYVFGSLLMVLGPLGMIAAGFVTDAFGGRTPARFAVRVAGLGTAAALPFALLTGFSADTTGSLVGLGGIAFCMSLPITMAPFIIQTIMPNEFRGVAISIYVLIVNLAGLGLGPATAALISDRLLVGSHNIGHAMSIMSAVLLPMGVLLFLRAARTSLHTMEHVKNVGVE
jgi:MFS family permease